jgi:hypothetical protein
MTQYAMFYRFVDGKIEMTHYSVLAKDHAAGQGWEWLLDEPHPVDDLEAVRHAEEHKWDRTLKERR